MYAPHAAPLALQVMMLVKQLVYDGVTICATIHSPTAYSFGLFDKLIMLVRGQVVYFGKQGASLAQAGGWVCRGQVSRWPLLTCLPEWPCSENGPLQHCSTPS